jgi:hypothetical protein
MFAPGVLIGYAALALFVALAFLASVVAICLLVKKRPTVKQMEILHGIDLSDGLDDAEIQILKDRAAMRQQRDFERKSIDKIKSLVGETLGF